MRKINLLVATIVLSSYCLVAQVVVTAGFDKPTGNVISDYIFGVNVFQGFDPDQAGTPGNNTYKNAMDDMNPGIIRYHNWDMIGNGKNSWIDINKDWDSVKISNTLKGSYLMNPVKMINIPSWPDGKFGVNTDDTLPKNRYQDFANWCADLVKICNIFNNAGIKYWEVFNERDNAYNNKHDELAVIFNLCALAMKAIDPTIKVGGPAFAQAWSGGNLDAFCKGTAGTIDFISYHSYATGDKTETNQNIYNSAGIGWVTSSVRNSWKKYSNRQIEFFHDEYNISYNPPDAKQTNYVSQIFDAISLISMINSGTSGAMAWNECDGWYGKMDNSYNKRPSFYLFQNFNAHLKGNIVCRSQVSAVKKVVTLASKNDLYYFLSVVNRADADINIILTFEGLPESVTDFTLVDNFENQQSGGISYKTFSLGDLTVSGYISKSGTVALFRIPIDGSTGLEQNIPSQQRALILYPNPATEKLIIQIPYKSIEKEIWIRDMTARVVGNFILEESGSLDLSSYSKGVYILEYIQGGKQREQKFIKY